MLLSLRSRANLVLAALVVCGVGCQLVLNLDPASERIVFVTVDSGAPTESGVVDAARRDAGPACDAYFCANFDDDQAPLTIGWDAAIEDGGNVSRAPGHLSPFALRATAPPVDGSTTIRIARLDKTFVQRSLPPGVVTLRATAWLDARIPLESDPYIHVLRVFIFTDKGALIDAYFIRRRSGVVESMQVFSGTDNQASGSPDDALPRGWVPIELTVTLQPSWPSLSSDDARAVATWFADDGTRHDATLALAATELGPRDGLTIQLGAGIAFLDRANDFAAEIILDDVTFSIEPAAK